MLGEFEKNAPGLAKRIIDNPFAQTKHRQELERSVIRDRRIGLLIGGFLAASAIAGAIACAAWSQTSIGLVLVALVGGGALTSFFGVYRRQKEEAEAKAAAMERIAAAPPPEPSKPTARRDR